MLHTLLRLSLVLFPIFALAQTANDLTGRYGYSDAETFLVRPEILMTAKYAEDNAACEMLIEPRNSKQHQSSKEPTMATAVVSEIIDELIPRSQRGILLAHSIESTGAVENQVFDYQNVTIRFAALRRSSQTGTSRWSTTTPSLVKNFVSVASLTRNRWYLQRIFLFRQCWFFIVPGFVAT